MTIDQLWFGWSHRGVEGLDRQQIIAASGRFRDRTHLDTQAVLRLCYRPEQSTFAWSEHRGLRIVCRREPTGLDGRGRAGGFFVHALIATRDDFPGEVLARLPGARIWKAQVPNDIPAHLPTLASIDALGLDDTGCTITDATSEALLAGHLANLFAEMKTALSVESQCAIEFAARCDVWLPPCFGLPAFSTHEVAEFASRYDMLLSPAPPPWYVEVPSPAPPDLAWTRAAQLLVEAHGRPGLVDALGDISSSLQEFASHVRMWASLDDEGEGGQPLAEQQLMLMRDRRLGVDAVTRKPTARRLVSMLDVSPVAWSVINELYDPALDAHLVAAARDAAAEMSVAAAVPMLSRLRQLRPQLGRSATHAVVAEWLTSGRLETTTEPEAVNLLGLLARPERPLDPVVEGLLTLRHLPRSVVEDSQLPLSWRLHVLRLHLRNPDPRWLATMLAGEPALLGELVATEDADDLRVLEMVLAGADVASSSSLLDALDGRLNRATFEQWKRQLLARMPAADRMASYVKDLASGNETPPWLPKATLDALVEAVHTSITGPTPLPRISRVGYLLARVSGFSLEPWPGILVELDRRTPDTQLVTHNVRRLATANEHSAAYELLIDGIVRRLATAHEAGALDSELSLLRTAAPLNEGSLLASVARGVLRRRHPRQGLLEDFIYCVCNSVEQGRADPGVMTDPLVAEAMLRGVADGRRFLYRRGTSDATRRVVEGLVSRARPYVRR